MARFFSSALVAVLAVSFANGSAAQGVQTGAIRGVIKDAAGQVVPQAAIHVESPALQGDRITASDQAGAYQLAGLAPGDYNIRFELRRVPDRRQHGPRQPRIDRASRCHAAAGRGERSGHGDRGLTVAADAARRRRKHPHHRDREAADGPHAFARRRARARPHEQHAQRQPGHDLGRGGLRQRVPARRRRYRRQPVRPSGRSVRRGSDRGNAGADLRGVGRIRALLRRRRQRRDQARRQHVLGQRAQQRDERRLDRGDAVREGRGPAASEQDGSLLRRNVRRSAARRSRVVLLLGPRAVEQHQPDAGADRRSVPAGRRSAPLGPESHGEADDRADRAGPVSRSAPDEVRALPAHHDRSDGGRSDRHAGQPVRHQLGRRARQPLLRDRPVFAQDQPSAIRQHQHAPAGFAVPHHRTRVAGRPALRPALLRSQRSGGSRQQPADRQRLVLRLASGSRHA